MGTISLFGETASVVSTTTATLNEEGKIDKEKAKNVGITTLATSATAIGGRIANEHTMREIHREYASAYLDSMSDEDLATALAQLDLLESEESTKETTKTI